MTPRSVRRLFVVGVFSVAAVITVLSLQGRTAGGDPPVKYSAAHDALRPGGSTLQLDVRRQQLVGVRTVRAVRGTLTMDVTGLGRIAFDESRLLDVNLKLEAWIRELYVSYVGQSVKQGQPLFAVYSPDLEALQANLIGALRTREQTATPQAESSQYADRLVVTPRSRLRQFDVAEEEIRALETTRRIPASVTFRSPLAGVVVEQNVVKGMRVEPGQTLYRLADLSVVLVEAEFAEADVARVKVGSAARITLDGSPDEQFVGKVLSVYPYLTEESRTLRARIGVRNPHQRLRPGMSASVALTVTGPEGLLVPIDAVIDSGDRQTVFVADGLGRFEPRTVSTGGRGDEKIVILRGIQEGDLVVERATFFLDSESQMKAAFEDFARTPDPSSPGQAGITNEGATLSLDVTPDPPRNGRNTFEVRVVDGDQRALADADVSIHLSMPAMPSMNMPAMHTEVALSHVGGGVYRGSGNLSMTGRWEATITARHDGRTIGTGRATLIAR